MSSAVSGAVPVRHGVLLTGVGGALGALLRWWLGTLVPTGDGFPWTTLAVNVSGSALLAALPLLAVVHRRPWLPLLLGTGFLGGFTTMSTFSVETVILVDSGHLALAAGYVAVVAGLAGLAVRHAGTPGDRPAAIGALTSAFGYAVSLVGVLFMLGAAASRTPVSRRLRRCADAPTSSPPRPPR